MKRYFYCLLFLPLIIFCSCRKSKISPNCWGEKVEALYVKSLQNGCPSVLIIGTKTYYAWGMPKGFEIVKDTTPVWVKYKLKANTGGNTYCIPGSYDYAKIQCMQHR